MGRRTIVEQPGRVVATAGLLIVLVIAGELALYTLLLPVSPCCPARPARLERHLGTVIYALAYLLSVLRAPLGLVPYLTKVALYFGGGLRYEANHATYRREALNMAGDVVNLALTAVLVRQAGGPPALTPLAAALYLPLAAESVRLLAERVPAVFSAIWQVLPHRCLARTALRRRRTTPLAAALVRWLPRYCRYYAQDDRRRTRYLLQALTGRAARDADLTHRLTYVRALQIVPHTVTLRGGDVRDVARGVVFIHRTWTSDPWLLAGLALRRAPWMFDPRYLRRPFSYWSQANAVATLCVLRHARTCPPYAVFQFGHEIRVARLHLFFTLLRRLGYADEEPVRCDGTFAPDQCIRWLERRRARATESAVLRPLWTEDAALADIVQRCDRGEHLTADAIATCYTYPLPYVIDVLLPHCGAHRACSPGEVRPTQQERVPTP